MTRPSLLIAISVGGALFAHPAAAQYGSVSKSLLHTVSVTIAPRVKVELSPVTMMSAQSVSASVKLTPTHPAAGGLGLSVHASQPWVLSMKSATAADRATDSRLRWSSSPSGEYTPITSADTLLATGTRSASPADTAVFFRDARKVAGSADAGATVILTVSAP